MINQESGVWNVLAVCSDPGGSQAVGPVLALLIQDERFEVTTYAYQHAQDVLKKAGLEYVTLSGTISSDHVDALIRRHKPAVVITGTSYNNTVMVEQQFIAAAKRQGIPCVAILDYWSNYWQRFSGAAPEEKFKFLPDRVAVMDEWAKTAMLGEGFEETRISVTGQPAFDRLAFLRRRFSEEKRRRVRTDYGVNPRHKFVVYASQPVQAAYGADASNPQYLGYTEHTVLKAVLAGLHDAARRRKHGITVVVKLHPKESLADFQYLKDQDRGPELAVKIVKEGDIWDMMLASDLVVGISSSVLLQACLLGLPVVSVQPNLTEDDFLITNVLGYSLGVYEEESVEDTLERVLFDEEFRLGMLDRVAEFKVDGLAGKRVLALVEELASGNAAVKDAAGAPV